MLSRALLALTNHSPPRLASLSPHRAFTKRQVARKACHMIDRFFLSHPRSVGESYGAHAATASRFGFTMILGGAACVVHAVLPFLFVRTASDTVKTLYGRMKA